MEPALLPGVEPSLPKRCYPKKAKKENSMSYDNDGRLRSESELRATNELRTDNEGLEVRSNTRYVVGGLAALAIILGVIFMLPHRTDNEAVNGRPTSAATTTGSGATSPNPAMNAPSTERPAPPATPGAPATR
jgi:hypothetical protein